MVRKDLKDIHIGKLVKTLVKLHKIIGKAKERDFPYALLEDVKI